MSQKHMIAPVKYMMVDGHCQLMVRGKTLASVPRTADLGKVREIVAAVSLPNMDWRTRGKLIRAAIAKAEGVSRG